AKSLLATFLLSLSFSAEAFFLFGNGGVRDDADDARRQSLLQALRFALLDLDVNVLWVLELFPPAAAQLTEPRPVLLLAFAEERGQFEVGLRAKLFDFHLKRPQEIAAKPRTAFQPFENLQRLLQPVIEEKQVPVGAELRR